MFENIKADFGRYFHDSSHEPVNQRVCEFLFEYHGLHATLIYRLGQWAEARFVPFNYVLLALYYPLEWLVRGLYGIHLDRNARIGPGFFIGHFGGIHVGHCSIGSNCSIQQRVVIKDDERGMPIIGDRVWVGAHTKIIGSLQISDGATIGAGAVVEKDVASRCLIKGNPARVVNNDYDNTVIL